MTTPLDFHCPTCKAAPGEKCRSLYGVTGKPKAIAPHKGRGGAVSFATAAKTRNRAAAKKHAKEEAQVPLFAGLEPAPAPVTPQDEYAKWRRSGTNQGMVTPNEEGYYSADARSLLEALHVNALRHLARRHLPAQTVAWLLERSMIYPQSYRVRLWEDVLTGRAKVLAHVERISLGWMPTFFPPNEFRREEHMVYLERVKLIETYWPPEGWPPPYTVEELKAMFAWQDEPAVEFDDGGLDARLSKLFARPV